ncbi:MAG: hypothetical protein AAF405_07955, partial [Pseudomonadota bacterium]
MSIFVSSAMKAVLLENVRSKKPSERRWLSGVPPLKWSAWKVQMNRNSGGSENGKQTSEAR